MPIVGEHNWNKKRKLDVKCDIIWGILNVVRYRTNRSNKNRLDTILLYREWLKKWSTYKQ